MEQKIAGYGLINNFEGVGLSEWLLEIDNVTFEEWLQYPLKAGLLGANKTMSAMLAVLLHLRQQSELYH